MRLVGKDWSTAVTDPSWLCHQEYSVTWCSMPSADAEPLTRAAMSAGLARFAGGVGKEVINSEEFCVNVVAEIHTGLV